MVMQVVPGGLHGVDGWFDLLDERSGWPGRGENQGILEAEVSSDVVRDGLDVSVRKQDRPGAEDVAVGELDLCPVLEVVGYGISHFVGEFVWSDRICINRSM